MATSEITPVPRNVEAERSAIAGQFQQTSKKFVSPIDQELLQKINEIHEDMRQQGVYPAMIVNFNPFPLKAQGPHLQEFVVPACKPPADAAVLVISTYKIDIIDKGGRRDARAILPIVLARDFVRQQQEFGRGGVECYGGSGDRIGGEYLGRLMPNDKRLPQDIKDLMKRAQQQMFAQCTRMVQEATTEWSRPNGVGKLNVDDRHRKAFEVLSAYKLWVAKEPEWVASTRSTEEVPEPCPRCKAEPVAGAYQCAKCGEWIKPMEAYQNGFLDPEEPGGKLALSRLTREQLMELDLIDTITPIAEKFGKKKAPAKQTSK